MKINNTPSTPLPAGSPSDTNARSNAATARPTPPPAPPSSTNVSLGATATQLQSMETSMASSPIANPNKVAEIKQAISEGRFQVNSAVVADKLLASVRSLISR